MIMNIRRFEYFKVHNICRTLLIKLFVLAYLRAIFGKNTFTGFSGDDIFIRTNADIDQDLVDNTILCGIIAVSTLLRIK